MKTIPNKFGVRITANDFVTSEYFDVENCSLAKALKRKFPKAEIRVGGDSASINEKVYWMNEEDTCKILRRTQGSIPKGTNITLSLEKPL